VKDQSFIYRDFAGTWETRVVFIPIKKSVQLSVLKNLIKGVVTPLLPFRKYKEIAKLKVSAACSAFGSAGQHAFIDSISVSVGDWADFGGQLAEEEGGRSC
jgi:hypothetical protein